MLDNMSFVCHLCTFTFSTRGQVVKHMKSHPEIAACVKRMLINDFLEELRKPVQQQENRERALSFKDLLTAEVEVGDFTQAERKELLELCMTKDVDVELLKELFCSWFEQCGQDPLALLQQLDVGRSQQELDSSGVRMSAPAKVLRLVIQGSRVMEAGVAEIRVAQFSRLLDKTKVIPQEELTPEKALYWRMMVLIFAREEDGDHLKHILPELPLFLKYFSYYILKKEDDRMQGWKFITIELLTVLGVYVFSGTMMTYNFRKLKGLLENKPVPGFLTPTIEAFIEQLEVRKKKEENKKNAETMVKQAFLDPGPLHMKMKELKKKASIKEANDKAKRKSVVEREIALKEMSDTRINEILELVEPIGLKPMSKSKKKKKAKKEPCNISK